MEIYSYFVVWIDKDKKERYSFMDIELNKMDSANDIHDKIYNKIIDNHFMAEQNITIKLVNFLKTSK